MSLPASEFGGSEGIVQPLPHPLTPSEEAMLMRQIDPTDSETSPFDLQPQESPLT